MSGNLQPTVASAAKANAEARRVCTKSPVGRSTQPAGEEEHISWRRIPEGIEKSCVLRGMP